MQHTADMVGMRVAAVRRWLGIAGRRGLVVLVASVSVLAAAASASASTKVARTAALKPIYVIGYQQNNAFWDTVGLGATQAAHVFGVPVRYEAPPTASDAGMISLIDAAMAAHPYGIAINYTDRTMYAPVLRVLKAGIKVVLYNNDRFEAGAGGATTNPAVTGLAFTGQNEHLSGGVLIKGFLPYLHHVSKSKTVLIINPFASAFVLTLRASGAEAALHKAGYNKTQELIVNGNDPEASIEATIGAYLQAHKNIGAIVALGDPAASPATRYIMLHKLNIPVATFDVDTETYDLMKIKNSPEKVALDQQPYLQGYFSVENLALEEKFGFQPVSINTGTFVVTAKNLSSLSKLVAAGKD